MAMVGFDFDGWENLHSDLLNEIAKKLYSYDDYIRFRCVCKEWNSMLPKIPNHRRDPWLVLPLDFGEESIDSRRVLEEKKIYHVSLPEMKDNFIRGSCHGGWLICVMVSDGKLRILNPFTKAHFDLPPISALPHIVSYEPLNIDGGRGGGQYNLLLDGEIWPMNAVRLHKRVVWKVVISSPPDEEIGEFMAVAIYGGFERLAFCRLNDKRWKDIPTGKPSESCFQDVIFFKEKIFAVDADAQLYVFDINFGEEQLLPMLKIGGAPPAATT